ncbi:MAG: PKD domain-containing protein, partial [Acidimicrobiales bacterium]
MSCAAVAALAAHSYGTDPPVLTIQSPDRYFSPNADGQEDDGGVSYQLSKGANVTVTIANASGTVLRTLDAGVSRPGGWSSFSWDGRNDAGNVVADGVYTYRIRAVDSNDQSVEATGRLGVDTRLPGRITQPLPGDVISGTATLVFTPTSGFAGVGSVAFYQQAPCCFSFIGSVDTPAPDGTFRTSIDTKGLAQDANAIYTNVSFTDAFGQGHNYTAPTVPVTVSNPPRINGQSADRYFSPNGDGQDDSATVSYFLSDASTVTVAVRDGASAVIATVETSVPHPGGTNSFSWDGRDDSGALVPDGVYTYRIRAEANGLSVEATGRLGVDTRLPGRITQPAPGDVLSGGATLVFTPSAGFGPVISVTFGQQPPGCCSGSIASVSAPSPDGAFRTNVDTRSLSQGPNAIGASVTFTDPFGVVHGYSSDVVAITIDNVSPTLAFTLNPHSGAAPLTTTLSIQTSHPAGRPLAYTVQFGDGQQTEGSIVAPYPTVDLSHTFIAGGVYGVVVDVNDGQGHVTTRTATITVSGSPNGQPAASLVITPTTGIASLLVSASLSGTDPDGDPLMWQLDFGDGSATASGSLPHGEVQHRYDQPGEWIVRLEVSDGRQSSVALARVSAALPEPLNADVGDDRAGVVGETLHFNGRGSRPLLAITEFHWNFGDGSTSSAQAPVHAFTTPGSYVVTLTVRSGALTNQDTAAVTISPVPITPGLDVKVTSSSPIAGADVLVIKPDGTRVSAVTGADGTARLQGLADGEVSVYASADGFLPGVETAQVTDGRGSVGIHLRGGEVGAAQLDSRRLTIEETVERGIDPNDPNNQNLFEFEINLFFVPATADVPPDKPLRLILPLCAGDCETVQSVQHFWIDTVPCDASCALLWNWGGGGGTIVPRVHIAAGQPVVQWLVIPGRATWLKEFFDVSLVVQNLAPPSFTFDNGVASLALPAGMSLAPTAVPQGLSVQLGGIPGGTS